MIRHTSNSNGGVVQISDKTLAIVVVTITGISVLRQSSSSGPVDQAISGDSIAKLLAGHLSGVTQDVGCLELCLESSITDNKHPDAISLALSS